MSILNLLPGPVDVEPEVAKAFAAAPCSHRGPEFQARFAATKERLRCLTGAAHVTILPGSGTLANDAVAAQLTLLGGRGLVLANGEFGDRLIDHAARHGMTFEALRVEWGRAFDAVTLESAIARRPTWVWAVHCETSTGGLNDLELLSELAERAGARLAIDAMSSLGAVPVDLRRVAWASSTSGKALRAYSGLAIVLHQQPAAGPVAARALDLAAWRDGAVGSTISSNLLAALALALARLLPDARFAQLAATADALVPRLRAIGLESPTEGPTSPAVQTFRLPPELPAMRLGNELRERGVWVSFESGYLIERNWIQLCLFGEPGALALEELPARLASAMAACRG
jgi:aspartate aminotransferase-like enzyme